MRNQPVRPTHGAGSAAGALRQRCRTTTAATAILTASIGSATGFATAPIDARAADPAPTRTSAGASAGTVPAAGGPAAGTLGGAAPAAPAEPPAPKPIPIPNIAAGAEAADSTLRTIEDSLAAPAAMSAITAELPAMARDVDAALRASRTDKAMKPANPASINAPNSRPICGAGPDIRLAVDCY